VSATFEAGWIAIIVVKRTDKKIKGFVVPPKRGVVERTFGWIDRSRRLSRDFEASIAWLQVAGALLVIRRLAR
jgi:transposase